MRFPNLGESINGGQSFLRSGRSRLSPPPLAIANQSKRNDIAKSTNICDKAATTLLRPYNLSLDRCNPPFYYL